MANLRYTWALTGRDTIESLKKSAKRDGLLGVPCAFLRALSSSLPPYLVLGDVRRTGCGARLPRIAHSQNIGPQTNEYAPESSNIGEVASFTVAVYVELMFVNASSVGGGGRAPCIAHSQKNRALKPTSSRRRLEDPRVWHAHRREWYVLGA